MYIHLFICLFVYSFFICLFYTHAEDVFDMHVVGARARTLAHASCVSLVYDRAAQRETREPGMQCFGVGTA